MRFLEDDNIPQGDEILWEVSYMFEDSEYDDFMEENHITKTIEAPDFQTAARYAEQHIRVMSKEDSRWNSASIAAIYKI